MIKPEELRIGNFIYIAGVGELRIEGITNVIHYKGEQYSLDSNCCQIQLTEEWLLNFGFKKEYEYIFIKSLRLGYTLRVEIEDWICSVRINNGDSIGYINSSINNVHQLQNLFFALNGYELELK